MPDENEEGPLTMGKVWLEKVRVGASVEFPYEVIEDMISGRGAIEITKDLAYQHFRADLRTYMAGLLEEEYTPSLTMPLSWWDHFKQIKFPPWALKLWPVRLHTVRLEPIRIFKAVCPHIRMSSPRECFTWLSSQDDRG